MKVTILAKCQKEIKKELSKSAVGQLAILLKKLERGENLTFPASRPMPTIGVGVHELRIKDKDGRYRVIYVIKKQDKIYAVHAFKKKTMKTPEKSKLLAKKRIKEI